MPTPALTLNDCGCNDEPIQKPVTGLLKPLPLDQAAEDCLPCKEEPDQNGLGGNFTPLNIKEVSPAPCDESPDYEGLGGKMKPLTPGEQNPFGKKISPGCSKTIGLVVWNFCGVGGTAACVNHGEWVTLFNSNQNRLRSNQGNPTPVQIDTIGTELTYPEVSAEMELIRYKVKKIRLEAYTIPAPVKFFGPPKAINNKTFTSYDADATGKVDGFAVGLASNLYQRLTYVVEYQHKNDQEPLIIASDRQLTFFMEEATVYKLRFELEQEMNPGALMPGSSSCCEKPCSLDVPPVKKPRRQRKKDFAIPGYCEPDSLSPMDISAFADMNHKMLKNYIGHDEANDIKTTLLAITKNSSKSLGKIFKNIPLPGILLPVPLQQAASCGGCDESPDQKTHKGKFLPVATKEPGGECCDACAEEKGIKSNGTFKPLPASVVSEPCCGERKGRKRNRKSKYRQLAAIKALSSSGGCGCH